MIAQARSLWGRWLSRRIPASSSVLLNQRRIFIIPTRVGVAYMAALLLMLLMGINYQNSLAYALTFLLASVFVVAILHTYRNLAGLRLKSGRAPSVFVGEEAAIGVVLESKGKAHQAISIGWPPQPLLTVDVPPAGVCDCQLNHVTDWRGWLRPTRLRVESRFPLGILVAWSWVDLDQRVLVYPRPLEGDLPLIAAAGDDDDEQGHSVKGQGVDDYQGLRSYQAGDSKRRLHWKAYSRGQGLLVKDFAAISGRDWMLDFDALSGDVETRLSLLCHWVLQLSEAQQAYGLTLPGVHLPVASGEQQRESCLRALALFGHNS
ncbi:DUF58 domain-containing protein [Ectopseudomonas mendocina]|uniref:DUF58 domain-containing protein n=1 Tax=Ectopseudomonas mendocina TaxID=300 RepID=A0ABZ2RM91_ECTME